MLGYLSWYFLRNSSSFPSTNPYILLYITTLNFTVSKEALGATKIEMNNRDVFTLLKKKNFLENQARYVQNTYGQKVVFLVV